MKAVIYARYSSDNQREESIEGQLRECMAYCKKNDITVLHIGDAALGFFQLLAEGGEYTAFPALNVHHGIRHILYKIIVHDFRHDRIDNGVFQRQLSDGLVLGVTGTVFLGIHTAVIMVLPALAGACPAFAYHHSPASAAKQLCCQ